MTRTMKWEKCFVLTGIGYKVKSELKFCQYLENIGLVINIMDWSKDGRHCFYNQLCN